MNNATLWGYIDQLESHAQGILDLVAELHQETGPRIPMSDTSWKCPVVPSEMPGNGGIR